MNAAEDSALIGIDGRPRFGTYREPLTSLNLNDYRPYGVKDGAFSDKSRKLKYRIKRWEYLGVCNKNIIFGIAVVQLGYMCNLFAYLFERSSAMISEYNILTLGGGAVILKGTSLTGEITFKHGKTSVHMRNDPETITVDGSIKGELSVSLSFHKCEEPLVCLTRVGLKGFNYTHKEAGIHVRGTICHKGVTWDFQEDQSYGVLDYTLGYLARQTFWNWASGGGIDKAGNRIGFNLVQGVNETGFTENAFWVNGCIVKTDVVNFQYDDLDLLKLWHVESNDGRVRLQFLPEGKRSANIDAGLIVSKFHQPFGRFEGTLRDGDQVYELQNVSGFTEEHYAKW
jgi:hypothetical protein